MLTPPGGHGESKRSHGKAPKTKTPSIKETDTDTPESLMDRPLLHCFNSAVQGAILKNANTSKKVTLGLPTAILEDLHPHAPVKQLLKRLQDMAERGLHDDIKVGDLQLVTLANSLDSVIICCRAVYALTTEPSGCIISQKVPHCFVCPLINCAQLKPIRLYLEPELKTHCTSAEHQRAVASNAMDIPAVAKTTPRSCCLVCDSLQFKFVSHTHDATRICGTSKSHRTYLEGFIAVRDPSLQTFGRILKDLDLLPQALSCGYLTCENDNFHVELQWATLPHCILTVFVPFSLLDTTLENQSAFTVAGEQLIRQGIARLLQSVHRTSRSEG